MNIQSTNSVTASTSGISDATITASSVPAYVTDMQPPRPDEIHAHALLPSWIQEIYSQISILSNDSKKQAARLDQFQDLLQRNQELQLALDQAHVKIAELEAQASRSSPIAPAADRMTPVPEKRSEGSSASKWADVAATPPLNDSPTKSQTHKTPSPPKVTTSSKPVSKGKSKRPLTLEQINRFYSAPSESHGYQFLYFTSRGREAISKIRAGFQVIGLSQSRILDIHFPSNSIIGFLVHNDYASSVKEAMAKLPDSHLITDFDPYTPTTLGDPKYATNADPLFLKSEAARIHQERLLRIIKRLPNQNIKLAVARNFCFQRQWISDTLYQTIYHDIYPAKAHKVASSSTTDDVSMDDATATQASISQSAASTYTNPADGLSAPMA